MLAKSPIVADNTSMTRNNIKRPVNKSAVMKSGRWPRQYDGYRDCGPRGKCKGTTLRTHRKG